MEEFDLKDGYELQTDGESVYAKTKEDKILRCPYCYNPLSDDAKEKKVCPECKKTLTGTQEHVKTLLKQNNLDIYIDLLEEKKLLSLPALSKMKKKEYQRIGIDENDIKKFVKIFSKKKDIGCIIALSVIAAVVLGILIFLVSNFGFKIVFLIFILLPVILWLWEEFFG